MTRGSTSDRHVTVLGSASLAGVALRRRRFFVVVRMRMADRLQ
jgi:hypothetical protein